MSLLALLLALIVERGLTRFQSGNDLLKLSEGLFKAECGKVRLFGHLPALTGAVAVVKRDASRIRIRSVCGGDDCRPGGLVNDLDAKLLRLFELGTGPRSGDNQIGLCRD